MCAAVICQKFVTCLPIFLCLLFLPGLSFPPFNHVGKGEGTATSLSESLPDGKPDAEKDESQLFPHGKCFLFINIECIYAWCISKSSKQVWQQVWQYQLWTIFMEINIVLDFLEVLSYLLCSCE